MTLDDIIITDEMNRRAPRPANYRAENELLQMVAANLGKPSDKLVSELVARAKRFCRAGSAGLSLLEKDKTGRMVLRWVALAGGFRHLTGGSISARLSPCGVCLERKAVQLYDRPQRFYKVLKGAQPPMHELLITPIGAGNEMFGTLWIASHEPGRAFDGEDARLLRSISAFVGTVLLEKRLRAASSAALQQARRNENFANKLLSCSPDCVKVLDDSGRIVFVNDQGLATLRAKPEDILQKSWFGFWNRKDRQLAKEAFQRARKRGAEARFQGFCPTVSGEPRWWDVIVCRLPDDSEGKPLFLAISRDVTERVDSAKRLDKANRELAEHAQTLGAQVASRTRELESAHARIVGLAQRLVRAQDEERLAISRDLHDHAGQKLTGLKLLLERAGFEENLKPETLGVLTLEIGLLQEHIRGVTLALRQAYPDHLDLNAALRGHFQNLLGAADLSVHFSCDGLAEESLVLEVKHTVFRIVQEALTNVIRHSRVRQASVSVTQSAGEIRIEISDRGVGFASRNRRPALTAGLAGMEERVVLLGGEFAVSSGRNKGTKVRAVLPLIARTRTP